MSVEVKVEYEGDLHCRAVHGPSGAAIATDAPVDNQGKGEAFSPTDLVGTALGTCVATIMGIAARREGWDITGLRATVVKEMVATPTRRIGTLHVELVMPRERAAKLDAKARAVLEAAGRGCPVKASLHPDVRCELVFRWDG